MNTASGLSASRVLLTGGAGFLGTAVARVLERRGVESVYVPRKREFDLTKAGDVERLFGEVRPEVVIHLAAEVGGIGANQSNPGRYFYANLMMGINLIEQSRVSGVNRFIQIGTICAYPKYATVPFKESDLWSGYPEETNAPYGVAKRALGVMLEAYHRQYGLQSAYVLPVNLFGPGDNFDLGTSHVIPALIRKCVEAKQSGSATLPCWGSGEATREFLFVDDAAEAIVRAAERINEPGPINLGTGREISIRELGRMIASICGFEGELIWDHSRPDGQPRRCVDWGRARKLLGWQPSVDLEEGLRRTVSWYTASATQHTRAGPG